MQKVFLALRAFRLTGFWIRPVLFGFFAVVSLAYGLAWSEQFLVAAGIVNAALSGAAIATQRLKWGWAWHHFDAAYILLAVAMLGTGIESAAFLLAADVYAGTLLYSRAIYLRQIGLVAVGVVFVFLAGDRVALADLTARQESVADGFFLLGGLLLSLSLAPAIRAILEKMLDARRAAEQAQRSRAESLVVTARTVAHEVRNPLASITGFSGILTDGWHELSDDDRLTFVQTIASEAERLNRLVGDLLDGMRLEAGALNMDLEIVGASAIIEDVVNAHRDTDKTIRVEELSDVSVVADPLRISQVLRNLVSNAMKYGGDVIELSVVAQGECAVFRVADNGPGVPADKVASIFGDFVQAGNAASSTGFGLGLGIARRLTEQMDGTLAYHDRVGGGATFEVSLPVWNNLTDRAAPIS